MKKANAQWSVQLEGECPECGEYVDYAEIHEKYLDCYYDLDVFNKWFFDKFEKTMDYLNIPKSVFTKK